LQTHLLDAPRDLFFRRLRRRAVLALFGTLNALGVGLLRLFPLLLSLLFGSFPCLLVFCLARLFSAKLLAPLLLFLSLDLREQIAGGADLVGDWKRACLPVIGDDEELGVELREDGGGSIGPVRGVSILISHILC
jgi:hypothetical protein